MSTKRSKSVNNQETKDSVMVLCDGTRDQGETILTCASEVVTHFDCPVIQEGVAESMLVWTWGR